VVRLATRRNRTGPSIVVDMPRKPKPPPDDPEQFKRFIDMAREIGADESPDALDRALEKVVKRTSPSRTAPRPSARQSPKRSK
jgi:hypothetical protein